MYDSLYKYYVIIGACRNFSVNIKKRSLFTRIIKIVISYQIQIVNIYLYLNLNISSINLIKIDNITGVCYTIIISLIYLTLYCYTIPNRILIFKKNVSFCVNIKGE